MLRKKIKQSVSLDQVFDSIQGKTPCCQLDKEQIKFSATFDHHRYCYDVLLKNSQKDFVFIFMDGKEVKHSNDILTEACIFFEDFNIPQKDIMKKGGFVQVKVPSKKVLSVIDKLHIFCPEDDETAILAEDFTGLDQKQIDKKCLEIDDLDDYDEEYNIV